MTTFVQDKLQPAAMQKKQSLEGRLCILAAGCCVDPQAVKRWGMDLSKLRRLGEAYRLGWLNNIMSRITPITLRKHEDYIAMADLFIETVNEAEHLLDRYDADLSTFCAAAGITMVEGESVPSELSAHVRLYNDICRLFSKKFEIEMRDPLAAAAYSNATEADLNPYLRDFMDSTFNENAEN